jgi:phenylalanyl-tRNA synthetase alpha chain
VEEVVLTDEFTHPKTGKTSNCFRINYRSMDRSLTNEEVNALQEKVREALPEKLGVELR